MVACTTFIPDGEPTLDANLGTEIEALKGLSVRVAVITNGSLLWCEDLRKNLLYLTLPLTKRLTRREIRCNMYLIMSRNRKQDNPIRGHPLTNQRRLLLELLRDAEGHIDAKELYRRASARDESISPATVYRALNLFKELGLVDEMRLGKIRCYYEVKQSPEHQHLVCKGCGKVMEIQDPHFQKLVKAVRREHGFRVTKAELYLEGYCPECEEKEKT